MLNFELDRVIPYKEYIASIYYHGATYEPPAANTGSLLAIADVLLKEVANAISDGRFDVAFYYSIRCLQVFEKTDIRQRAPAESRKFFCAALEYSEDLKKNALPHYHEEMMKRIAQREPERQRIVAQQLLTDNGSEETVMERQKEHELRKRQLLLSHKEKVDSLKSFLDNCGISSIGTVEDAKDVKSTDFPDNFSPLPPLPYNAAVSGGDRYKVWHFSVSHGRPTFPRRGIVNLGNTCYMNSVLQVVNSVVLGDYFAEGQYVDTIQKGEASKFRLVNSFCYIMRELRRIDCDFSVSASPFKTAFGEVYDAFNNFKQQDANEFLHLLLDGLHSQLNTNSGNSIPFIEIDNTKGSDEELARAFWWQYSQKNKSVIVDYCAFQERSMVRCPDCGQCSRSFDPSMGIEVPILSGECVSLEECLRAYCKEEVLSGSSLYLCSGCKKEVAAQKQLMFYSVPQVLFITLKRFQHYGDFSSASKVSAAVFFPPDLDMASFMCSRSARTKYRLVGIVNHLGNMHGGHYTSDTCGADNNWCHFSDEVVTEATQPDMKLAYILCYVRLPT